MDRLAVVQVGRGDDDRKPAVPAEGLTIDNYKDVLKQPRLPARAANSFGISIISTVLAVIFATLAAYAIARLEFRGKRLVLSVALAIAMFPVVALVGPLFDLWRTLTCSTPGRA